LRESVKEAATWCHDEKIFRFAFHC
jgi:hypothetical protein